MSEKRMLATRLFLYLITVSVFLLILSSVFTLQSNYNSFFPTSVLKLIVVNNHTSNHIKPNVEIEPIVPMERPPRAVPPPPEEPEEAIRARDDDWPLPNNSKDEDSVETHTDLACDPAKARLRVYMYDLPPLFHFGLLGWKGEKGQIWPDVSNRTQIPSYPGGLNLQHSMEYWLTLDLLSSNVPNIKHTCTAVRVKRPSQADVIFVPFFSSLSYNQHSKLHGRDKINVNKILQHKLMHFLFGRKEWRRVGGRDHLIIAHHPNSMLDSRKKLHSAMFVLADFGRYPAAVANIEKDIIAPYRHVVKTVPPNNSPTFDERPTLVYFQGAIYRKDGGVVRQELYYLLKDEEDVHFTFGSVKANGINKAGQGMASSKFCLNIAGDTPSSNRLFDSIASHCVPVIISDDIELPYEDVLDYTEFCVFVRAVDSIREGYLLKLLRGIKREKWTEMWMRIIEIVHEFEYQYPSQTGDAVDMIWQAVSRKVSKIKFNRDKKNRYRRSQLFLKSN
ncbi:putative arabinosyltransferase ARAD1 [Cucurbita argyrosperma subsp. argyrosperma]|uniref:Probable arabinosyltransferase ARAD1 n=1 Tax=Cucurbita moschata TaxID=3662 RepID=A0A6J1GAB6_CUCMO|nr:probable arabinosyltransferase ARAD1 [Cucurbita moschata]XP_022948838.1 probable arabinosyltransferase ARAD1 [Cucurbita moschata]KAG7037104.1 putative arabinosyltransferase ARAD1 [Cucurbita argyrosperma subsp. argyrosperma]